MSVKPLSGGVDNGLATVRGLHAELQEFKDSACPIRNEFHSNLASDATKGLADGDGTKSPIRLAQSHYGRATYKWANRLRNFAL